MLHATCYNILCQKRTLQSVSPIALRQLAEVEQDPGNKVAH